MLELETKVININLLAGHEILQKSHSMYEYSWMVQRVWEYIDIGIERDAAIHHAINDCLKEGFMVDFINEHGSETNY